MSSLVCGAMRCSSRMWRQVTPPLICCLTRDANTVWYRLATRKCSSMRPSQSPARQRFAPSMSQDERESQKLWQNTAKAVRERNHEVATDEKTKIEDRQRGGGR